MPVSKHHHRKKRSSSAKGRKWSGRVARESNALDLDKGVFTLDDPDKIARSLDRSAKKSTRKKANAYRSAMSMLAFYINRAGKNLPAKRKKLLTKAKDKLRALHAKDRDKK